MEKRPSDTKDLHGQMTLQIRKTYRAKDIQKQKSKDLQTKGLRAKHLQRNYLTKISSFINHN